MNKEKEPINYFYYYTTQQNYIFALEDICLA